MTHPELFDRAIAALRREAQRLESSGLRWPDIIALISGAALPEPLVLMLPSAAALAMLRRHSDERHAPLFEELDRLAVEHPELARCVIIAADSWSVATLEWSSIH